MLILLTEDEALVSISVQKALEDAGFSVRSVSSGEEAVAVLDAEHADFRGIITDIRLGSEIDGWDVARHARELIPDVPVVYMSGDSAHEHTSKGVPQSVMLQKPFVLAQVITAISSLLNSATPQQMLVSPTQPS
ncbi:response regulator [Sphingomonas rosea]|uniref:Response regulator n=1 Tax=Sphingomonas rosea TaxID=335605 RepID=A0ABP7TN56_9SPHN